MPDDLEERMRQVAEFVRIDPGAEDRAWQPEAASMEALVLKVLGGWEVLTAQVNWSHFNCAGQGGPPAETPLAVTIRRVAESYKVRWPHDKWSAACHKAGLVRHKLAHLLYVYRADNESPSPDRKLAFMRLGFPGQPRKVEKRPGELHWGDSVVPQSQQTRHVDLVTERELIEALASIKWLVDCCECLNWLGSIHRLDPRGWPDNYELEKRERDQLAWWFPDWGDRQTTALTAGQLWV